MNHKQIKNNHQRGQAMLITVLAFLFFSLIAVFGIVNPVLYHSKTLMNIEKTKKALYLAESGMEDVLYRLKTAKQSGSSNTLYIDGKEVVTTVVDNANGKTITSLGNHDLYIRKIETKIIAGGIGAAFFYGLQTGTGGIVMLNNSLVDGNVYANGDILGSNGATITGSAYAANLSSLTTDQANESPATPPNTVQFGQDTNEEDLAQSFEVSETKSINKIAVYIKKESTPANLTVRIASDLGGSPGATLAQGTLSAALVTDTFGWIEVPLSSNPELTAGQPYWLVLDGSSNPNKYYLVGANSSYASGNAQIGRYGDSWEDTSPAGLDAYFRIYMGGITSTINNVIIGSEGGDAHAHNVTNSNITGLLYCQTGSGNNKSCNTSLPDPAEQPFPISDANIQEWKSAALSGGIINGNVTLDDTSSSMGLKKIVGNLTLINNADLTIIGTLWVTGNITIDNGAKIRLSASYGPDSGLIVTDGYVSISNNSIFYGSGEDGSYVMVIDTLICPGGALCNGDDAIIIGNNAGAVILNAQKAGIHFSNNAEAKSAVGKKIQLDNNATIKYETGLVNINFLSGPSAGFDISSWKEVE